MLNTLLEIVPGTGKNAGNFVFDNYGEALIYALVGFLIVFAGIVIIIAVIWLIGLLMRKTDNLAFLTKGRKKKEEPAPAAEAQIAAEDEEVPDEVKAAIIAAVMAYCEAQSPKCDFKVKRIKRI